MSQILIGIICVFFFVGGIDYILGNKLGLGEKFEEGLKLMGSICLSMVGIYSLAPILANYSSKLFTPVAKYLCIDPSVFPACIFTLDIGGYQIAQGIAHSESIGLFSAVVLSSTLGTTISFTIPVALCMLSKEDIPYFSKGLVIGLISISFGCIVGGLWQGIKPSVLLWNLIPIIIFSGIVILSFIHFPKLLISTLNGFGKIIIALSVIGLLLQGFESLSGIRLIAGLSSFTDAIILVAKITFTLTGALPMLSVLDRILSPIHSRMCTKLGVNSFTITGLIGNLASNLLVFSNFDKLDSKGKIIVAACSVSMPFVLGGQLGFVTAVAPTMVTAFVMAKVVAGLVSIMLATKFYS